jgi:hypothetical protein
MGFDIESQEITFSLLPYYHWSWAAREVTSLHCLPNNVYADLLGLELLVENKSRQFEPEISCRPRPI